MMLTATKSCMRRSRAPQDKVAMDLGFYYMANAMGRLIGVLLGGFLYYYTVSRRTLGPESPLAFVRYSRLAHRIGPLLEGLKGTSETSAIRITD